MCDHVVDEPQEIALDRQAVGGGVDADHRVSRAVHQAVQDRGGDAGRVVRRVVGLEAHRHRARQADRVAEARDHAAFAGGEDQILVPHELADGRSDFWRDAGRQRREALGRRVLGKQPLTKRPHREVRDRRQRRRVMAVADEARDLVRFVGRQRRRDDLRQWNIGQTELGCDVLLSGGGGDAGELVA